MDDKQLTQEELEHLKQLMGKEIGWQIKHKVGKEQLCRDIYGKIVKQLEHLKMMNEGF